MIGKNNITTTTSTDEIQPSQQQQQQQEYKNKQSVLFIPPKKRLQITKKLTNQTINNYVDHITSYNNLKQESETATPSSNLTPPPLDEQQQHDGDDSTNVTVTTTTPNTSYSESSLLSGFGLMKSSQECLTSGGGGGGVDGGKKGGVISGISGKIKKRVQMIDDYDLELGDIRYNNRDILKNLNDKGLELDDEENDGVRDDDVDDDEEEDYPLKEINNQTNNNNNYLTMTGTIKRGKKKGELMDVQLNISRDELEKINAKTLASINLINSNKNDCCYFLVNCNLTNGVHIFILSLICLPFVVLVTSIYSFYIGTLTWYNMFNYFSEEKSYFFKVLMTPILIVTYPFLIILCTFGLGVYAGLIQLSLCGQRWFNEICDIEKGFYGWLCSLLHLSDCSPYDVVILTELQPTINQQQQKITHSSTEELSL